jgi:hypothetical protein
VSVPPSPGRSASPPEVVVVAAAVVVAPLAALEDGAIDARVVVVGTDALGFVTIDALDDGAIEIDADTLADAAGFAGAGAANDVAVIATGAIAIADATQRRARDERERVPSRDSIVSVDMRRQTPRASHASRGSTDEGEVALHVRGRTSHTASRRRGP